MLKRLKHVSQNSFQTFSLNGNSQSLCWASANGMYPLLLGSSGVWSIPSDHPWWRRWRGRARGGHRDRRRSTAPIRRGEALPRFDVKRDMCSSGRIASASARQNSSSSSSLSCLLLLLLLLVRSRVIRSMVRHITQAFSSSQRAPEEPSSMARIRMAWNWRAQAMRANSITSAA